MILPLTLRALLRPDALLRRPPSLLQHYYNGSFDARIFLLSRKRRDFDHEDEYGWDADSPELEPAVELF